jgi:hypothetical protein
MSAEDSGAGAEPAFQEWVTKTSLTIEAALTEAITRKLEYVEWTPQDLTGRIEVTSGELGVRIYCLDKTAILQVHGRAFRWLLPSV